MQTKEGSEVTFRSKEGVDKRNSALVKRYNPAGELPETSENTQYPSTGGEYSDIKTKADCQNAGEVQGLCTL